MTTTTTTIPTLSSGFDSFKIYEATLTTDNGLAAQYRSHSTGRSKSKKERQGNKWEQNVALLKLHMNEVACARTPLTFLTSHDRLSYNLNSVGKCCVYIFSYVFRAFVFILYFFFSTQSKIDFRLEVWFCGVFFCCCWEGFTFNLFMK